MAQVALEVGHQVISPSSRLEPVAFCLQVDNVTFLIDGLSDWEEIICGGFITTRAPYPTSAGPSLSHLT
jgi:hypothetical protein